MPIPRSCSVCTAYEIEHSRCRRRAVPPSTTENEWAKWPLREAHSRCMEGLMDRKPIHCKDCFFWDLPDHIDSLADDQSANALPIWRDQDEADKLRNTKYCIKMTVSPSGYEEMYYPRRTHATDSCGDGETPEEFAKRMKKQKK